MNRLQEILKRKAEIRSALEGTEKVDLAAFEKELRELDEEQKEIETRQRLLNEAREINEGNTTETRTVETFNGGDAESRSQEEKVEKREEQDGQALLEKRAITVDSNTLVLPQHTSSTINGTFNSVSGLIDRVKTTPLMGGESYKQPYEKTQGEGGYTAEKGNYTDVETVTDYADIKKTKITAYEETTEEAEKLPQANYAGLVKSGVGKALRKKITKQILVGTGVTDQIAGIFSAAATAIEASTDLEIASIDETTLDEIIFSYGGPEEVEDVATLILSKADLKKFAKLRDNQGKKVYEVKTNGNTGTIDGVPYIINSACAPISSANTAAGSYAMAYGPLSNYELTIFADTEIKRSEDFKFKQGIIAHRGSTFVGGNVVAYNGFIRVKKAVTV